MQIIGHVVAEFYANKPPMLGVDSLRSQTLLCIKSYLMNFRHHYLMMEKMYKICNAFVRMGNLPALLPNATPLVSRFFAEM
jgi:hypothetical protein